jgi:hypothetical protein
MNNSSRSNGYFRDGSLNGHIGELAYANTE